jgi:epoxyqueuosine reductase
MSLEQFVKEEGWTDFGIVGIRELRMALKKHKALFEDWLSYQYHADMDYLPRMKEDRYAPEHKLPEVRSVIVLLSSYGGDNRRGNGGANRGADRNIDVTHNEPNNSPTISPSSGVVARYARGRDYHKVLKKKLIRLSNWLQSNVKSKMSKVETYVSVDSGPTVDRVLAEVAGLGFFGKNSNLIDPKRGSYFFIASLMTNLELPPTPKRQMPNCGSCTRCIDACPTGAIVRPGMIDARRCISYLTIENKGDIPLELREKVGDRLFGCDICQEVCPFNERGVVSGEWSDHSSIDLKELLSIKTDGEFLERFAGWPMMRAKRRGMLRNACVVAGNSGDLSLIPLLQGVIEREEDEMLKEHARWAIDRLRTK